MQLSTSHIIFLPRPISKSGELMSLDPGPDPAQYLDSLVSKGSICIRSLLLIVEDVGAAVVDLGVH